MAKSIFRIATRIHEEVYTIKELASVLVKLFYELGTIDTIFRAPIYAKDNRNIYIPLEGKEKNEINILSNLIIDSYRSEIVNPDVSYSRDEGFRVLFTFKRNLNQDNIEFSVTGRLGCKGYPELNIEHFSKNSEYSINWYFEILSLLTKKMKIRYGGLQIILPSFIEIIKSINSPLGWITYFSKDYEVPIPDDLEGLEYEYTEKGKYLILTRDDITKDTDTFQFYKNKLLDVMEEIKRRVPEYHS